MILQIIFGSGLTEEPALGDETASDSNAYTGSREDHATRRRSKADDRTYPIKLRRSCRCSSE